MPDATVTLTLTLDQEALLKALLAAMEGGKPKGKVQINFGPVSEQTLTKGTK